MEDDHGISKVPPELLALVFSLFLRNLSHVIYELDYVEKREDITAENFLLCLEDSIQHSQDQIKQHGLDHAMIQRLVAPVRKYLFEIDIHRLKWPLQDDLD